MQLAISSFDDTDFFDSALSKFNEFVEALRTLGLTLCLSDLERRIDAHVRVLARDLLFAVLDKIGCCQAEEPVVGSDAHPRPWKRPISRTLTTLFGEIHFDRLGYYGKGLDFLFPADAHLNLPPDKQSHEIKRMLAEDVSKMSYEATVQRLADRHRVNVPKAEAIEAVESASQDFISFYQQRTTSPPVEPVLPSPAAPIDTLLVITTDGKGIVMRREGLREATRQAAETEQNKLDSRLSKGEKHNRKRMSQVASVYEVEPQIRTAEDVVGELRKGRQNTKEGEEKPAPALKLVKAKAPRAMRKRVWAGLDRSASEVIHEAFEEAHRRDPEHRQRWVGLVDGNPSQLKIMQAEAAREGVELRLVMDFIHVVEYLWKAAWGFYEEGDKGAEEFVKERMRRLLQGQASQVAKGLRRKATNQKLSKTQRKGIDKCANYLLKYKDYLRYDEALAMGAPIATGVIEGACRHLIKDRMDITGARWSLSGAEAVLRIRSMSSSQDFEEYWRHHLTAEYQRNHASRYKGEVPKLAMGSRAASSEHALPALRLVVVNGAKINDNPGSD